MKRESGEAGPLYFDDVQEHTQIDALLDGVFKLICLENGSYELYDISGDGGELSNVTSQHPQQVEKMYAEVLRIRQANRERQKRNIAAIDENLHRLSEAERQRITKQLKSLGYIR